MPFFTSDWGNPSSTYRFGAKLKGKIEEAREQVAEMIEAHLGEVIFTSCATESNNAAIDAALKSTGKRHVITSAVEHSSVRNHCKALERPVYHGLRGSHGSTAESSNHETREGHESGYRVTYLPVDREGLLNSNRF